MRALRGSTPIHLTWHTGPGRGLHVCVGACLAEALIKAGCARTRCCSHRARITDEITSAVSALVIASIASTLLSAASTDCAGGRKAGALCAGHSASGWGERPNGAWCACVALHPVHSDGAACAVRRAQRALRARRTLNASAGGRCTAQMVARALEATHVDGLCEAPT